MKLGDLINESSAREEKQTVRDAPPPGKIGEFINSAQAAKIIGVNMSRVRQLVGDGSLKTYEPEPGRRDHMFKLSEVEAFAKKDRPITGRPPEGKSKKKSK